MIRKPNPHRVARVAAALRRYAKYEGPGYTAVAEAIGVPLSTFNDWARGISPVPPDEVGPITDELGGRPEVFAALIDAAEYGFGVHRLPGAAGTARGPLEEVLDLVAASAAAMEETRASDADGLRTRDERARIRARLEAAQRELAEAIASLDREEQEEAEVLEAPRRGPARARRSPT
jgi:hypothetical protein